MPRLLVLPLLFLLGSSAVLPAAPALPSILETGFSQLPSFGPEQALRTWTRDSRLVEPETIAKLQQDLASALKRLGTYRDREVVAQREAGGGSALVWVTARFEYGTLYCRFLVFENRIINDLAFSTDPTKILPRDLLETP
jgi:hypothetical protein